MRFAPPERVRRTSAAVAMWGGWAYSVGILTYALVSFDTGQGKFAPLWTALTFILALAVAITGTFIRSRMRFTDMIIHTFRAGLEANRVEQRQERREESRS